MRGAGRPSTGATYDRHVILQPWLLALGLVLGVLVLFPARRLQLAGLSARTVGLYALAVWLLGFVMAIRPVGARFLIPIVLLAYIAPFVAAPEVVGRVLRRGAPRDPPPPPMKNVTPPDDPAPGGPTPG
jgi:hypothetical protein